VLVDPYPSLAIPKREPLNTSRYTLTETLNQNMYFSIVKGFFFFP
jgi:hypothetical protein